MNKVKLKLTFNEAECLLLWLQDGEPFNITNDFRYKAMVKSSAAEVMRKLKVATIYLFDKKKTFMLTYTQALSITLTTCPLTTEWFQHFTQRICGEVYDQILRKHAELLPEISR